VADSSPFLVAQHCLYQVKQKVEQTGILFKTAYESVSNTISGHAFNGFFFFGLLIRGYCNSFGRKAIYSRVEELSSLGYNQAGFLY